MISSQPATVVDLLQKVQVYVLLQFEPLDESAYMYICILTGMYVYIYICIDLTGPHYKQ